MLVASMVVKVVTERAGEVKLFLDGLPGITTYGVHRENNIIAVAEVNRVEELEKLTKEILAGHPGVLTVLPTFLGSDQADLTR